MRRREFMFGYGLNPLFLTVQKFLPNQKRSLNPFSPSRSQIQPRNGEYFVVSFSEEQEATKNQRNLLLSPAFSVNVQIEEQDSQPAHDHALILGVKMTEVMSTSCSRTKTDSIGGDGSMIGCESPLKDISFSGGRIASETNSNDLPNCLLHFEEVTMADNCKWDDDTTMAFVHVMVENIDELTSSIFKPSMFNTMAEEIQNRTGVKFTTAQLSTKFQRMRIEWRKYNWLLRQTGLGIHPGTGAILATDEQWKQLESMQEGVNKFRRAGLQFYDELTQLFCKSTAQGSGARGANVRPPNSDEERELQQNLAGDSFVAGSSIFGQFRDTPTSHSTEPTKSSGKRKVGVVSPDSGEGSGKKSKSTSSVELLTQLWAKRELHRDSKKAIGSEDNDPYSIPKCMEILNAMNLEANLYYRAIHLICDRNIRLAFMTMLPDMRLGFLESLP